MNYTYSTIKLPGWILFLYLVYSQAIPALHYEWGIAMGTQDPPNVVTEVGVAFFKGFAVGDLVFYIPILGFGLFQFETCHKARICLACALGTTVYWPIVCLATAVNARGAPGWTLDDRPFYVALPMFILWALWGIWRLAVDFAEPAYQTIQ